ncbi:hypothetical protein WOLCODRAFT_167926 [Wolfiporia cocos MD-104 SS10]|uniref:Uncharacterized protein n=1 Tax=Wolfiporia cocos (strain MD-104) TaxID=742152 RepID=A0A2H3JAU1_WOLCO|nr:hypothetical protein WOLCODRAFT_167926 [Wolfiporia cocos MD-104 SS10]
MSLAHGNPIDGISTCSAQKLVVGAPSPSLARVGYDAGACVIEGRVWRCGTRKPSRCWPGEGRAEDSTGGREGSAWAAAKKITGSVLASKVSRQALPVERRSSCARSVPGRSSTPFTCAPEAGRIWSADCCIHLPCEIRTRLPPAPFHPLLLLGLWVPPAMNWNDIFDFASASDSESLTPSLPSSPCLSPVDTFERDFCSNFSCCGLALKDLHALLDHFEEHHVLVLGRDGHPVYPALLPGAGPISAG